MKRETFILFLITNICLLCGVYAPVYSQNTLETLAVLDFNVTSGVSPSEAATLTNTFRSALTNTIKYTVLERTDMEEILKEQAFTLSGVCNTAECAVEIGQLLSAEKMVVGDIGKIGKTYSMTVRLVNVSTAKIEISLAESYKGETEGLLEVMKILAQKLAGIYETPTSMWWYIGGTMVVGAGVAAAVLLTKDNKTDETEPGIGSPPGNPVVP